MGKSISILIPSVPQRAIALERLKQELFRQKNYIETTHPTLGTIEILTDVSETFINGGLSIGEKRDRLLKNASGDYLCFLDDDDNVAPNYLEELIRGAQTAADVITFDTLFKCDGYWSIVSMDLGNDNQQTSPSYPIKRNVWHTCLIRAEIAKKYSFKALNHNEDWTWVNQFIGELKTKHHIPYILSEYIHSEINSLADQAWTL